MAKEKRTPETIIPVSFSKELGERYLAYALSTIMSRSLPDVRDGLKPVHRRLLYAMQQLKLFPESGFKKCARVVGDVIGKYHPHGDTAVYDALVRLAQDFSLRYPLIEGQGNFGSIDGDNAAAMRYTEARLSAVAELMLSDINANTVDFRQTYDGEDEEPLVLPAGFPNLLANGTEGIAVGMATSIPPHNVSEICDALQYLIKTPNAGIDKLVQFIPGPDFPTGGVLVEPIDSIKASYASGKGSFRLRAAWKTEDLGRGQYQVVITEIPYQIQKSKLIEKMADLYKAKKLALLADIRDESTSEIRIVLEPKSRSVDANMLMESLFKLTDLETRIPLNMNVIDGASPRVMALNEVLLAFIAHRKEVLVRKSNYRLAAILARLEILEGFLIAYLNLDAIIKIIREEDEPKPILMKKFKLTDVQAEAILNMRLRQLRKLEEHEIKKEHRTLSDEKKMLQSLLKDESLQYAELSTQIKDIKERFGAKTALGKRRTVIGDAPTTSTISIEAFVEKEPITVLCSEQGWIRAMKGQVEDTSTVRYREGDRARFELKAYTTDKLILFSTLGKCFTIACDKLPSGKSNGEALRLLADMKEDEGIVSLMLYEASAEVLLASRKGKGFIVTMQDLLAQTKSGKTIMNIGEQDALKKALAVKGDHVAVIGNSRKLLIFPLSELPKMKRGSGVALQKYKDKDAELSDVVVLDSAQGLQWQAGSKTRTEANITEWLGKRAGVGKLPPAGFPKNNRFSD